MTQAQAMHAAVSPLEHDPTLDEDAWIVATLERTEDAGQYAPRDYGYGERFASVVFDEGL